MKIKSIVCTIRSMLLIVGVSRVSVIDTGVLEWQLLVLAGLECQ